MSLIPMLTSRRASIALGAFIALGAMIAEPAAADRGYRGGRHWGGHGPRVGVVVGLPPIVLVAGRPVPYDGYDDRYEQREYAYEHGYADGYDDGYDDRAREEWRRRHRHHHHDDCDD